MKFLFDILHPAHVHFFRNALADLRERGHEVLIVSRDKDLTHRLLDLYGIPYRCISREAGSRAGLAAELVLRNARLLRLVMRERPDAMASIGGITTAQVGFLTRTRNYVFYDTEHATLSNLLTYPFATQVVTPECYERKVLGRHATYPGYHELAYVHPDRFTPDASILREAGLDPEEPFSVVRFVTWKAMHDVGASGFSMDAKRRLVRTLSEFGRVFISSEDELPEDFEPHRLPLPPHQVHHLLAFARLFIGESATMASESVILGTPAIYVDATGRGYTNEQEERYGLCLNFRPHEAETAILNAREILAENRKASRTFRDSVARMLADKRDVSSVIVDKLEGRSDDD